MNPIGRIVRTPAEPSRPAEAFEVVGVVKDIKYEELSEDAENGLFPLLAGSGAASGDGVPVEAQSAAGSGYCQRCVRRWWRSTRTSRSRYIRSTGRSPARSFSRAWWRFWRASLAWSRWFWRRLDCTGSLRTQLRGGGRRSGLRMALGALSTVSLIMLRDVAAMLVVGGVAGLIAIHYCDEVGGILDFWGETDRSGSFEDCRRRC